MPDGRDRGDAMVVEVEDSSPASITVQRRIEWTDTDASGYWHNSAPLRLVEVAERALIDRLGLDDDLHGRLPRVNISANFTKGLRFGVLTETELWVASVGRCSITYEFEVRSKGVAAALGTVAAVLVSPTEWVAVPWPDDIRERWLTAGPQTPELLT